VPDKGCDEGSGRKGNLSSVLVIGYGNQLRRDDGLGPKVALAIGAMNLPGVRVITCHQLTPELADPISRADAVIFIDAAVAGARVQVTALSAASPSELRAHTSDPSALLGMARLVFNRCPQAWWITVPAFDMGFGEGLSDQAQETLNTALRAFDQLWTRLARS
jgi:hydrogenase maturation protease